MEETHSLNRLNNVNRLGLNDTNRNANNDAADSGGPTPTISYKDKPEAAEVGKATQIDFLVSGESRWYKNNITIELLNENKELSFSKTKWENVDYEFTLLTKVTSSKPGQYKIQFKADKKLTSILYIESKYLTLEEPTVVSDTKVTYTDEQKAKLITTVYGESAGDENLMVNIPWIYYNLTKTNFNKLSRSSFYANRNSEPEKTRYGICMYYLGQGDDFKEHSSATETRGKKIKDYCVDSNSEFVNWYKRDLDIIKAFFEKHIFNAEKVLNPYYKWDGQGYYGDMNIRMYDNEKTKWAKASQYFHLQNKGYVKNRYVKEIIAYNRWDKDATTYLCDDKSIEKYFKDNPTALPKYEEGKCTSGKNKVLCNKDEKNAIPGVHFRKDR